jgi:hypothetical protein
MNLHAAELIEQIQAALAGVSPIRQLTDAEEKTFDALLRKAERLGESLREPPLPAEPEQPADPLAAGAQLDAMAWEASQASGGKLSYTAALHRIVADPDNLDLVLEYQGGGKTRRR